MASATITLSQSKTKWSELFPTRWSPLIFILYMALFINQGILVTASQSKSGKGYTYNTVMAVLLTEFFKLIVSAGMFIQSVHSQINSTATSASCDYSAPSSCSSSCYLTSQLKKSLLRNKPKNLSSCSSHYNLTLPLYHYKLCSSSKGLFRVDMFCCLVRNSVNIFINEIRHNQKVFFLYFIPAGLYCLYNNLAYVNLVTFDPTTYFLLLQFRVVVTGIVFQFLFQKQLSRHQWISLIFLTIGCMVKEINFSGLFGVEDANEPLVKGGAGTGFKNTTVVGASENKLVLLENPIGVLLILTQVLCSSGAGVYNEFLLKRPAADQQKQTPVLIQNVCLYVDSIICNVSLLFAKGELGAALQYDSLAVIFSSPIILAVVINNAAIGIVTSFFLAQLNSILKTFASALELMFTAVLCWMIFGIPIHFNTVVAIFIVTLAIFLYSKQPVVNSANTNAAGSSCSYNSGKVRPSTDIAVEDMQKLLDGELEV